MAKEKYSLLVDFIEDFEKEIEMKSKIISSEKLGSSPLIYLLITFESFFLIA